MNRKHDQIRTDLYHNFQTMALIFIFHALKLTTLMQNTMRESGDIPFLSCVYCKLLQ
jgi:hypothetical protein